MYKLKDLLKTDFSLFFRRQDYADYDMETLLMREQQLQELLARESELSPGQREELLRQLAAWPAHTGAVVSRLHYSNSL